MPQFYLRRFCDASGRLWAWERDGDRMFVTTPGSVAAENAFYYLDAVAELGHDPLTMEKQFADLEGQVACITSQWLDWIRVAKPGDPIPIPEPNRDLVALFLSLQFLRTADARDILARLASASTEGSLGKAEQRSLHIEALWDDELVSGFTSRIRSAEWIFARNMTEVPFVTSDNPVAFRSADNSMWVKVGVLGPGTYAVYPLAPDVVMYCHPREGPWSKVAAFSGVSPVSLTADMVDSENMGQVFMAYRLVMSPTNDFAAAREFARTIGTDTYAEQWRNRNPPKPGSAADD
ncbi:MAG TPA: DUF4238 domain-containing protein [Thermoleophilaceae bacterium]|nr:DUF4238 domain-containing protein [Thermoleophilaceae bacterium]